MINDIPNTILISIFEFTNIRLSNAEHYTKIINTHNFSINDSTNILKAIIETSTRIDFDDIDIDANKMMQNAIQNIKKNLNMSYTHETRIVNEYDNNDLICKHACQSFSIRYGRTKNE